MVVWSADAMVAFLLPESKVYKVVSGMGKSCSDCLKYALSRSSSSSSFFKCSAIYWVFFCRFSFDCCLLCLLQWLWLTYLLRFSWLLAFCLALKVQLGSFGSVTMIFWWLSVASPSINLLSTFALCSSCYCFTFEFRLECLAVLPWCVRSSFCWGADFLLQFVQTWCWDGLEPRFEWLEAYFLRMSCASRLFICLLRLQRVSKVSFCEFSKLFLLCYSWCEPRWRMKSVCVGS